MMRQRERMTFKQGPVARGTVGTGLSSNPTGVGFRSFAGVETLLNLQRTHGNAFVQRLVQRKLAVRRPGDKYEQEADRVADAVVRRKDDSSSIPAISFKRGISRSANMYRMRRGDAAPGGSWRREGTRRGDAPARKGRRGEVATPSGGRRRGRRTASQSRDRRSNRQ